MIAIQKQKMINDLIQRINTWNEYSEKIYGYSKQDAENFLKRLQVGVYNSILKNSYWFANIPDTSTLIKIEIAKKNINSFTNITEENYLVYSTIHNIKEHLEYIYYWNKAYKTSYHTKLNNYEQTPATFKEQEAYDNLYNYVLTKNYTWQEARDIVKNIQKLNIEENQDFPHNVKEIEKIFTPTLNQHFKKYPDKVKYSTNILNLNKVTNELLNKLTITTLPDFIKNKRTCPYEEYIRQLLINTKVIDIDKVKYLLNSLLTPKKVVDLSELDIPQPYLTTIRKHYSFIFKYAAELEYLEESVEILNTLVTIYKDDDEKLYKLTLINNAILISYGIIPIPLTNELLEEDNLQTIITKTINQTKYFNTQNKGI